MIGEILVGVLREIRVLFGWGLWEFIVCWVEEIVLLETRRGGGARWGDWPIRQLHVSIV